MCCAMKTPWPFSRVEPLDRGTMLWTLVYVRNGEMTLSMRELDGLETIKVWLHATVPYPAVDPGTP